MTIINQKSISGITSITFASAGDDLLTFHSNNGTERFRIDNSGNTKITAGIVTTLTVTGDVDIADKIVHTGDTNTAIRFPGNDTFTVETSGSEAFRVDGGQRLLVGTTSNQGSSRKLQVAATDSSSGMEAIRFTTSAGSAPSLTLSKSNSDTLDANTLVDSGDSLGYLQFKAANGSGYNTAAQIVGEVDGTPGVNDMPGRLVLSTTADGASTPTERLRIDSSGRIGVGVVPTAQFAHNLIQIGHQATLGANAALSATGQTFLTHNLYFDTGGTYQVFNTSSANEGAIISLVDGIFKFSNSAATTGTPTVTERLRIDSSGRVLVGTTVAREHLNDGSDSAQVFVQGTTQNTSTLAVIRSSNNDGPAHLVLGKARGTGQSSTTVLQDNDTIGHINFEGADGSHLIRAGQISCVVDATPGGNDMPGRLSFSVTSDGSNSLVERMRINRRGFLKVGPRITDGSNGVADLDSFRHEFTSDNNGWTIIVTHTSGSASEHEGILIDYKNSPNGTGNSFIQGNDSNGTRFRVASNGGLYNYQSNDSNLSDEREKKNIVSLDTKWDKVISWELKKFHYNEAADSDDLRYGVIAQQVEQHCPEVLSEWVKQESKDAVLDEDGNVVTPACWVHSQHTNEPNTHTHTHTHTHT